MKTNRNTRTNRATTDRLTAAGRKQKSEARGRGQAAWSADQLFYTLSDDDKEFAFELWKLIRQASGTPDTGASDQSSNLWTELMFVLKWRLCGERRAKRKSGLRWA
jgi:hypothetical protein